MTLCISGLATQINETEFDYLTGSEVTAQFSYISGWLDANLGLLNTALYTNFTGECPDWCQEEEAIYSQLFLKQYYNNQARKALKGIGDGTIDWIRVQEGDSVVVRTNKNEVSKTFRGLSRDAGEEADKLIKHYLSYQASPREVGVYPSATGAY